MNKLLIIDDEDQIRKLLARILELEGYEVFQAADCRTGLKQAEINSPEVTLCDVRLPDGNGVDFISNLKKVCPLTEIIMLTAHGNIPMEFRQSRTELSIILPKAMTIIKLFLSLVVLWKKH